VGWVQLSRGADCRDLLVIRNETSRHLIHQDKGISLQAKDSRLSTLAVIKTGHKYRVQIGSKPDSKNPRNEAFPGYL